MSIEIIILILSVVFIGSIVLLNLPKIKKGVAKKSSKKKLKKKKKENEKLKVSKVVEQIRPILKPADGEKAERENKEIEAKKQGKQLPAPNEVKTIDFKYSANNNRKSVLNSLDEYDSKMASQNNFTGPNFARTNQNNNALPYSISVNKKPNPLNRDIKKEFEDIRKFLDLPENKNGGNLQQKYEATKAVNATKSTPINSFKNSNRIDASLFNEPASHYADYRKKTSFVSENSISDDVPINLNTMKTQTKYSKPVQYEPVVEKRNKGYTYKINRDKTNVADKLNLNYDRDEYLNFQEENIDLNKLSPKLKRLIITNILNRKKFD